MRDPLVMNLLCALTVSVSILCGYDTVLKDVVIGGNWQKAHELSPALFLIGSCESLKYLKKMPKIKK